MPYCVQKHNANNHLLGEFNMYTQSILSGDRPTGKLHLGHYVGSLTSRLSLAKQASYSNPIKILIADTQVLNNDVSKAGQVKENILHLMRAYNAIGLYNCQFILQSEVPYIFELGTYLSNLVALNHNLRNPTLKAERAMYGENLNMGFVNYPIMQTADILIFNATEVPVGQDQVPILLFGNDLIDKFHHNFHCDILKKINPILSESPRLIGIDGKNKMSKSLDNAIYLDSSDDEIHQKVFSMYTDPNHIRVSDPGTVEGNVVFMYLDVFHDDKDEVSSLKEHYKKGGLGDVTLKKMLVEDLKKIIAPIRENYYAFSDETLLSQLSEGSDIAFEYARENMKKIKSFMFK